MELGYRFYLAWRTRMKSFIAPWWACRFLDRILIEEAFSPDRNSAIFNVPLYEASTVFTFGVDIGFTIDLGSHFYVGLDAELRFQGKASPQDLPRARWNQRRRQPAVAPCRVDCRFRF